MGQTSLLELDDPQICWHYSKDFALHDVIHQLVLFHLEDPCHQIWPILDAGTIQLSLYLRPMWVAGHCDEEVRLVVFATDGHTILKLGVIPAWAAYEGTGEDLLSNPWAMVISMHGIHNRSNLQLPGL